MRLTQLVTVDIIQSAAGIAPDRQQVEEHTQRIANDADLAVCIKIPVDGDFYDAVSMTTRNVKKFDVECPAHECLIRKYIAGHTSTDTLEPTLGILQARQHQPADQCVEDSARKVTVCRLVVTDRPRRFTGADGNIGIFKLRWKELADFFDRHGKVGIAHEDIFAFGFFHAALDRASLAANIVLHDTQVLMFFCERLGDFIRMVAASIFHHNDLSRERLFVQKLKNLFQRAG